MTSWKHALDVPRRRSLLYALILAPSLCMYLYTLYPVVQRYYAPPAPAAPSPTSTTPSPLERLLAAPPPRDPSTANLTVNLVLATLASDDISWTAGLEAYLPNLRVVRYVSDSTTAPFRPPVPRKGREATIWHTYLHDFYDALPDVSLLVHAHERAWHVDGVLQGSLRFALPRLDLAAVLGVRGGYANLRVSWRDACPDWINTSLPVAISIKQEEPYMAAAWRANFDVAAEPVPEILAGPCCSQFAVSRDAVRRRPREQYARSRDWLVHTEYSDYIAGRTWEHMFPWLLAHAERDCPRERETYCAMYGVCFADADVPGRYNAMWQERDDLRAKTAFWRELLDPSGAEAARLRIREIDVWLDEQILLALERGRDEGLRAESAKALYDRP